MLNFLLVISEDIRYQLLMLMILNQVYNKNVKRIILES